MDLRERAKKLGNTLPLMENREKAEISNIVGQVVTITDYGFMKDENDKEYVAFIINEDTTSFYFGGQVLTDNIKELDEDGYGDQIRKGLPVKLGKKMSKAKREYTTVEFFPEV